jgi:cytochrome c-type biogenesis protein
LKQRFVGGPVANWTEERFGGFSTGGLQGQFCLGLLLGAVWSPCVGPTLGAASILAAQGNDLPEVALTMLVFGLGAGAPLLVLGALSRELLTRMGNHLLAAGKGAKMALGCLLVLVGVAIITGADKRIETMLVDASPQWLTNLTTHY